MRERLCGKNTSMALSSVSNSANAGNAFNLLKNTQKSLTFSMNSRDWRSPLERMMYCVRMPRHLITARSAAAKLLPLCRLQTAIFNCESSMIQRSW